MEWVRAAAGARHRLWLLLGVLAVALSLLAMHQLSSNHTAAGPSETHSPVATDTMHLTEVSSAHGSTHAADDHPRLSVAPGGSQPASGDRGCPGCADHSAMAMTCLAALVLLIGGFMLTRPRLGRGLWLRPVLTLLVTVDRRPWAPRPRSLAELAVSRT